MHRPKRILFLLLVAVLASVFAHPRSAVAGTPAFTCTDNQAQVPHSRLLASARPPSEKCLNRIVWTAKHKQLYYSRHRWMLAPRYDKCWQVRGSAYRRVVCHARTALRVWSVAGQKAATRLAQIKFNRWLTDSLACIHHHEGAWNANTGTYFGGMQMDMDFQRSYGSEFLAQWGTADNWPIWAQLVAAKRAYASGRGFGPWPYTAVECGLSTARITPIALAV